MRNVNALKYCGILRALERARILRVIDPILCGTHGSVPYSMESGVMGSVGFYIARSSQEVAIKARFSYYHGVQSGVNDHYSAFLKPKLPHISGGRSAKAQADKLYSIEIS